jgi:hypothetical protein
LEAVGAMVSVMALHVGVGVIRIEEVSNSVAVTKRDKYFPALREKKPEK